MNQKNLKVWPLIFLIAAALSSALLFLPVPAFANPPCGGVIVASTTLTANVGTCPATGLTIGASGITLNCNGFNVLGSGVGDGIYLKPGITGVTVVGCTVIQFAVGYYLNGAVHDFILGSKAVYNKIGFYLVSATYNTLYSDVADGSSPAGGLYGVYGFAAVKSNYNNFILDTGTMNTHSGFYLTTSLVNDIVQSTGSYNTLYGFQLTQTADRNYLTSNQGIDNKQIGFYDLSTGAGSLGTDNFYSNNFASSNGIQGSKPLMLGCPPVGAGPQC